MPALSCGREYDGSTPPTGVVLAGHTAAPLFPPAFWYVTHIGSPPSFPVPLLYLKGIVNNIMQTRYFLVIGFRIVAFLIVASVVIVITVVVVVIVAIVVIGVIVVNC